jgi:hypothetical protein
MADAPDLTERISSSIQRLALTTKELNKASDEFGRYAVAVDEGLRKLNIGIEAWFVLRESINPDGSGDFRDEFVGYARMNGTWGLALKVVKGNKNFPEDWRTERWVFNEGPRSMRISAIDKLPELLEELRTKAEKVTRKLQTTTARAEKIAEAVWEGVDTANGARRGGKS